MKYKSTGYPIIVCVQGNYQSLYTIQYTMIRIDTPDINPYGDIVEKNIYKVILATAIAL